MPRALDSDEIKMHIVRMLTEQSDRDKQVKIGASQIGDPCDYCIAQRLNGIKQQPNRYWMGARMGTMIHEGMEALVESDPLMQRYEPKLEFKVTVGEIPGYGVIKSRLDLWLQSTGNLIDWKTTTKLKLKKYKLDGVPKQYLYQQMLYAWAVNKEFGEGSVKEISLAFLSRDGSTDADIWVYQTPYDESLALEAWDRLCKIWKYIEAGNDVEKLRSDLDCYYCENVTRRTG